MLKDRLSSYFKNEDLKEIFFKANSNLFLRLIGNVLAYFLVFTVVKLYGPNLYGQYSHSITIFLVFRLLSNLGIKPALVRAFAEIESGYNVEEFYHKSIKIVLLSGLLGSLVLYFFSAEIAQLYGKEYLSSPLKILALALIPYNLIDVNSATFKGLRNIKRHTFLENIGNPLFSLSFISLSFLLFKDFESVFYSIVIALTVLCAVSFILISKAFQKLKFKRNRSVTYAQILKVSLPMYLTGSMDLLGRMADILVLGFFCTDFQIGAYHLVSRLATAISIPMQALNSIITPKFRQLFKANDKEGLKKVTRNSATSIFFLSFLSGSVLILFAEWIIVFFESEYIIAKYSLYVLVLGMILNSFFGSVLHLLNMTDGHKVLMYISIIVTALNITLNILLIPEFDILGASISTAGSMFLFYLVAALYSSKRLGFLPYASLKLPFGRTLKKN